MAAKPMILNEYEKLPADAQREPDTPDRQSN